MNSFLRPFVPRLARWASLILIAGALVVPASASAAAFRAHLKAPNHTPTMNRKWPITVTVTRGRARLSGKVSYRFLFQDQVVKKVHGHGFTRGVYRDALTFPRKAVGFPLTLQVVVSTRYGTVKLDWAVKTRK